MIRSVKRGGHVIVSTFGPEGPTKCSGLDVVRYDAESLHDQFGAEFRLVEHATELHKTPSGGRRNSSFIAIAECSKRSTAFRSFAMCQMVDELVAKTKTVDN